MKLWRDVEAQAEDLLLALRRLQACSGKVRQTLKALRPGCGEQFGAYDVRRIVE